MGKCYQIKYSIKKYRLWCDQLLSEPIVNCTEMSNSYKQKVNKEQLYILYRRYFKTNHENNWYIKTEWPPKLCNLKRFLCTVGIYNFRSTVHNLPIREWKLTLVKLSYLEKRKNTFNLSAWCSRSSILMRVSDSSLVLRKLFSPCRKIGLIHFQGLTRVNNSACVSFGGGGGNVSCIKIISWKFPVVTIESTFLRVDSKSRPHSMYTMWYSWKRDRFPRIFEKASTLYGNSN